LTDSLLLETSRERIQADAIARFYYARIVRLAIDAAEKARDETINRLRRRY